MMQLNYVSKKTPISRSNVFIIFLFLVQLFFNCILFNHPLFIASNYAIILIIAISNRIARTLTVYVKMGLLFGLFILIFSILLNPNGETILIETNLDLPLYGDIIITLETVINSLLSAFSLVSLVMVFGLMNKIINPDGLTRIFAKLKLPYSINFMIMASIRFFPLLVEDLQRITDVQKSRGFELEGRNFLVKIKNQIVLILPLLTNSLDRSIQMAEALESRGFGIKQKRTTYNPIHFRKTSYLSIMLTMLSIAVSIVFFIQGYVTFNPYPLFGGFGFDSPLLVLFAAHLGLQTVNYLLIYMEGRFL